MIRIIVFERVVDVTARRTARETRVRIVLQLFVHFRILVKGLHARFVLFQYALFGDEPVAVPILIRTNGLQSRRHVLIVVDSISPAFAAASTVISTMIQLVLTRPPTVVQPALIATDAARQTRHAPQSTTLPSQGVNIRQTHVQERIYAMVDELQYEQRYFDGEV